MWSDLSDIFIQNFFFHQPHMSFHFWNTCESQTEFANVYGMVNIQIYIMYVPPFSQFMQHK
jgi:hypothetical protein